VIAPGTARISGVAAFAVLLVACASGPPSPVALQQGLACTHCRMIIVDAKLAAQIVAPGEEPRFFDDIGCLARYLTEHPAAPDATAYVADHSSGAWVRAAAAVYSRSAGLETPMGSHIIAHANEQARANDVATQDAERLSAQQVFGGTPPGGNGGD
jgi:copper chaperone NosL